MLRLTTKADQLLSVNFKSNQIPAICYTFKQLQCKQNFLFYDIIHFFIFHPFTAAYMKSYIKQQILHVTSGDCRSTPLATRSLPLAGNHQHAPWKAEPPIWMLLAGTLLGSGGIICIIIVLQYRWLDLYFLIINCLNGNCVTIAADYTGFHTA